MLVLNELPDVYVQELRAGYMSLDFLIAAVSSGRWTRTRWRRSRGCRACEGASRRQVRLVSILYAAFFVNIVSVQATLANKLLNSCACWFFVITSILVLDWSLLALSMLGLFVIISIVIY